MATSSVPKSQNPTRRNERAVDLGRHAAKCRVCNHPSRAAIEFDFLNWRNPFELVKACHLRGLSTIYRHAHATGLFARRRLNLRFALERIVERVGEVPVTASAVIRSVRAITRINDAGEWIDPPARIIISREDSRPPRRRSSRAARKFQPPAAPIFEPALLEEPSSSPAQFQHAEQSESDEQEAEQAFLDEQPVSVRGQISTSPEPETETKKTTVTLLLTPPFAAARNARKLAIASENHAPATPAPALAAPLAREFLIGNQTHSPEKPNA